jgi:hypothetical protein
VLCILLAPLVGLTSVVSSWRNGNAAVCKTAMSQLDTDRGLHERKRANVILDDAA